MVIGINFMNIDNIESTASTTDQQEQSNNAYTRLLNEYSQAREDLKKMLADVEQCKKDVLKSVADSNDYRNKYAREERLKTLSTFFQNELQIRQEYGRSLISEIDIRRKLEMEDKGDMEIDIRQIMKQINEANRQENKK